MSNKFFPHLSTLISMASITFAYTVLDDCCSMYAKLLFGVSTFDFNPLGFLLCSQCKLQASGFRQVLCVSGPPTDALTFTQHFVSCKQFWIFGVNTLTGYSDTCLRVLFNASAWLKSVAMLVNAFVFFGIKIKWASNVSTSKIECFYIMGPRGPKMRKFQTQNTL